MSLTYVDKAYCREFIPGLLYDTTYRDVNPEGLCQEYLGMPCDAFDAFKSMAAPLLLHLMHGPIG